MQAFTAQVCHVLAGHSLALQSIHQAVLERRREEGGGVPGSSVAREEPIPLSLLEIIGHTGTIRVTPFFPLIIFCPIHAATNLVEHDSTTLSRNAADRARGSLTWVMVLGVCRERGKHMYRIVQLE